MTRPAPNTPTIQWPLPPGTAPLWRIAPDAKDLPIIRARRDGTALELIADPFSS